MLSPKPKAHPRANPCVKASAENQHEVESLMYFAVCGRGLVIRYKDCRMATKLEVTPGVSYMVCGGLLLRKVLARSKCVNKLLQVI